jgi:hypothetical protein
MGAEWWDYRASFDTDTLDVKAVLEKHKSRILKLTPDWDSVKIADNPGLFILTPYPETKEQIRAFYESVGADFDEDFGGDDEDYDGESEFEDDDDGAFLDELPRGQGFYQINYEGNKPVSVTFCGYSCD